MSFDQIDWEKAEKIFAKDKEGILDLLSKEKERYPYGKEILTLFAAGLLISASFILPGLPRATSVFWRGKGYRRNRLTQTLKRLHKQKIVEVVETKDGSVVRITKNGFTKALKYKFDEMQVKRQKFWDKKWRIVIFDIPNSKKRIRDVFRKQLKQLGFFPLQESVFVHAFPCFDEVEFLRQIYNVDVSVTYIVGSKIEGQDNLKSFFKV